MGSSKVNTPTYDVNASKENQIWSAEQARKYGNVGVNSALGGYNWTTNPDGTQSINVNLSDTDKQRLNLQNQALNNINLDPTQAQNTYYNMATRYMKPEFAEQRQDLESNLINKGIPIGSQSWNRAINNLEDNQNQALSQARDNALFQGQQYTSGNIGNINNLGAGIYNPLQSMVQGTGGQFGGQYDSQFASESSRAQQEAAYKNALREALINSGGAIASGMIGTFSDKRLKENIEFIKNIEGINIYKFDYINGEKNQIGVIAQELLETPYNNAVFEDKSGYYKVDYNKLPILVNKEIEKIKNDK